MSKPSRVSGAVVALKALGHTLRHCLGHEGAAGIPAEKCSTTFRLDAAALSDRDLLAESMQCIASLADHPDWTLEIGKLQPGWGPYRLLMLLQALQAGTRRATGNFEIRLTEEAGASECRLAMQLATEMACNVLVHPKVLGLGVSSSQCVCSHNLPGPNRYGLLDGTDGIERTPVNERNVTTVRMRDGVSHF